MNNILNEFRKAILKNLNNNSTLQTEIKIIEFNKVESREEEDTVELAFIFINQTNQQMLD